MKNLRKTSSLMTSSLKRLIVLCLVLTMAFVLPESMFGQQTLDEVKTERGLDDNDVLAALKTFMPRGGRDEYFAFVGTGNSGTMVVYGIPSMRIYKYVGVFAPEPWQGYGFDDESSLMLKKNSPDNRIYTYGDMRYPALGETAGEYDGKYLFYSDGANSRVALLGLDDFETKQVLANPLFINCFPGVAVTQNTEYVIQSSQYPAPWVYKSTNMDDFKSGVTFWKFHDPPVSAETGHHIGRMLKDQSFSVELPAFTLDMFDAGKLASGNFVVGIADKNDEHFLYVLDYLKLEAADKVSIHEADVVLLDVAVAANAVAMIPLPAKAHKVKFTKDGKYFITAMDESIVFDFDKMKAAIDNKTFSGTTEGDIPLLDVEAIKHGSIALGNGVMDFTFEYRENVVYSSVYNEKKIVRWNYNTLAKESELELSFKPGQVMVPQGMATNPHSNYLTVVNKEGLYENYLSVGTMRPSFQHLIDISSDVMRDIYTMSIPQANIYGSVAVLRTVIKPIIRYETGTNTRTGEISEYKTVAGKEKIEREGNRVHIFGTLIRSHIVPEIVEVNEGDIVTFHLTNLERAEDETHGFTINTYGKHGSFEPGKTASLTFTANRPGIFPYYCTEFCSALHLEMEGILLIRPKNYTGPEAEEEVALTEEELAGYKKNYEEKLAVIDATQEIINGVVQWLKDNNYQDYEYVNALVEDALDQLGKATMSKENHERYAAEEKWRDAFLWAEQYWQYQVKTADVGLRAKELLGIELEAENEL
ncbi:MAG: cytochrome C [Bacteroidota bacterium]|nr:cytochrome C [Bacteroidota bacterium]